MYRISKLFNPEVFQGKYKSKNYFEGWYYKLVDKNETNSFALIPGIAYDKDKNVHAFIQLIDSLKYNTEYFRFAFDEFNYDNEGLDISIGNNKFSRDGISIDIKDKEYTVKGTLKFFDIEPFPKKLTSPGIMGPFSFVPFMECYHGVVNIHHKISGGLCINNSDVDFTDGYGYIEKDWGRSFPKWWVWIQCNHFSEEGNSLMFSIAEIPWLKNYFTGFISFLKIKNKIYRFATYTGAKIKQLDYKDGNIEIVVQDKEYTLSIKGKYNESGILKAPKNGLMERLISESISSNIWVVLKDKKENIIFEDAGKNAGLEVVGRHMKSER
ncbi:MAG: tocopherol cyclase family protein [Gudongella sp.]|nr:tocopherol cyclase family protein [Gudongella sp.]